MKTHLATALKRIVVGFLIVGAGTMQSVGVTRPLPQRHIDHGCLRGGFHLCSTAAYAEDRALRIIDSMLVRRGIADLRRARRLERRVAVAAD